MLVFSTLMAASCTGATQLAPFMSDETVRLEIDGVPVFTYDAPTCQLSYNEQRELDALPDKIDTLEKELESIRSELSNPDIYRLNPARAKELTDRMPLAEQELDAALERWTTLAERCD